MNFRLIWALFAAAAAASAQYTGPAIISRGEAPAALSVPRISFAPSVMVAGTYDTGISGVAVDDRGQLATGSSFGEMITWSVSGVHSWKRTRLAMVYTGAYGHYNRSGAPANLNHNLMLGVVHQINRRMTIEARQTAGITTRNYVIGGLAQTAPFDPLSTYVPTTDFFDNRNVFLTSSVSLSYQKTKRLSFAFAGLVFTNNRESKSLRDAWGTNASGDVQYRLSARSTVGGNYTYQHFAYSEVGGGTDAHTMSGVYSRRLTKSVEISGMGGVIRTESKFLQQRPVDPAIAALLGITRTEQIIHSLQWQPSYTARISKGLNHSVAYLSAGRSITPGNGLFLTSTTTNVIAGYNYTGFRNWGLNAQAGYVQANATGDISGRYGNWTEMITGSRRLGRFTSLYCGLASRNYHSPDYQNYNRRITTVTVGLTFAPGEVRLPTW